jgi:hypothetical protein
MVHTKTHQGDGIQSDAERRRRAMVANAALWHPVTENDADLEVKNWSWPIDLSRHDRRSPLTSAEAAFLARYTHAYARNRHAQTPAFDGRIDRLVTPIEDVFQYLRVRAACRVGRQLHTP